MAHILNLTAKIHITSAWSRFSKTDPYYLICVFRKFKHLVMNLQSLTSPLGIPLHLCLTFCAYGIWDREISYFTYWVSTVLYIFPTNLTPEKIKMAAISKINTQTVLFVCMFSSTKNIYKIRWNIFPDQQTEISLPEGSIIQ